MGWTFRTGRLSDAGSVLLLWAESDAEPTRTDDVTSLQRLIVHDPAALIVAEEDGRLVGSVIAGWDGWRGSVYRLVVAPSHRHRGLGRRLLAEAESRLAAAGAVRSQAIVVETEPAAVGFWRATSWEQQACRLRFVKGLCACGERRAEAFPWPGTGPNDLVAEAEVPLARIGYIALG
jgi:ribosomal protein S18 acetylase RimI-like enzyme